MVKQRKGPTSALYIGSRSALISLLVIVFCTSVVEDEYSVTTQFYDWAMECCKKYPGLVEDVQDIFSKEDILNGVEIFLNILTIGSTIFLLCDIMMLIGVITGSAHGKWLILPWICFNIIYNVLIFTFPIFLVSSISIYFFSWRLLILIGIVIAIFINKFIINWSAIDVVIKQFTDKKCGLKSWKIIAPDLTSDRICLVSSVYE